MRKSFIYVFVSILFISSFIGCSISKEEENVQLFPSIEESVASHSNGQNTSEIVKDEIDWAFEGDVGDAEEYDPAFNDEHGDSEWNWVGPYGCPVIRDEILNSVVGDQVVQIGDSVVKLDGTVLLSDFMDIVQTELGDDIYFERAYVKVYGIGWNNVYMKSNSDYNMWMNVIVYNPWEGERDAIDCVVVGFGKLYNEKHTMVDSDLPSIIFEGNISNSRLDTTTVGEKWYVYDGNLPESIIGYSGEEEQGYVDYYLNGDIAIGIMPKIPIFSDDKPNLNRVMCIQLFPNLYKTYCIEATRSIDNGLYSVKIWVLYGGAPFRTY